MAHATRLAILATVFTLVGCAHAGRGSTARVIEEAPVTSAPPAPSEEVAPAPPAVEALAEEAPADGSAAAAPSPARPVPAAADPELVALRAQAREAEEAAGRAREEAGERPAAEGAAPSPAEPRSPPRSAAKGMVEGVGWTFYVWGRVCFSHPLVALVCIAGFPYYWGAAVGAVVLGGAIGAAIGSEGAEPSASARRGRPGSHRGLQRDGPPSAAWNGGPAVAQGGVP